MAEPPIMTIKGVKLSFGLNHLFREVDLNISRGDKICLVGRNGSGKSTLLKIIAQTIEPDDGEIFLQPGIKISYMPQEPDFSDAKTLRDIILSGLSKSDKNLDYKADILIKELGILEGQKPEESSGGELRKAFLAKALIGEPDILLLDEPTNHLDMPTIETLEKIIGDFSGALIVISHDRMFLNNVSKKTFWLDRGILRSNNKGFMFFEEWQEQVFNQELIEQKNLNKKIAEETEWLHKGVTARRKRNIGRLHRLHQLRIERRNQIKQTGKVSLTAETNDDFRSKLVIEAKHISKAFGERKIVNDFSTKIIRGNKIGIVGPNGSGKTTLLKMLTKHLEPDAGFVRIGKNLEEAYFDQNREALNPKKTLWQTLCDKGDHIMVRGHYRHVVAYLKDFLFKPDQAYQPVLSLSGGEKNRLMLAVALAQKSNFLVLDEPTNDLDMDTLDLLQEVLDEYEGTILIISHDRDFLDRVVSSVIYMPGDGSAIENAGSYSDLLATLKPKEETKKDGLPRLANKTRNDNKEKSGKLSYNQKRLLETLPGEIEKMEKEIAEIENALNDNMLYVNDPIRFDELTLKLSILKEKVEKSEMQWLEISQI